MTQYQGAQYPPPNTYGRQENPAQADRPQRPEGDVFVCPECGAELTGQDHRNKHAVMHYGDDLIPPYPNNDTAAERKAALMDVDPASLRGFPQRRW